MQASRGARGFIINLFSGRKLPKLEKFQKNKILFSELFN